MAILQMMGVTETIAETIDDYVAIAVRLAQDGEWRMALHRKIAVDKHRTYRDQECIAALNEFFCGGSRIRSRPRDKNKYLASSPGQQSNRWRGTPRD